ncbi:hypothetical protein [Sedimentibacter sp.]|uniref:hypothetical protein n=1 Tax=Sedimentibacter sp. TaxID=1960295 RepID=UPI0028B1C801|nr:hypothetical protein [Sedimentibacter sp.]
MKKEFMKNSLYVMIIICVIGFIIIFSSGAIGKSMQYNYLQKYENAVPSNQLERYLNDITSNFRTAGQVISTLGGFGILLCGYAHYKEL